MKTEALISHEFNELLDVFDRLRSASIELLKLAEQTDAHPIMKLVTAQTLVEGMKPLTCIMATLGHVLDRPVDGLDSFHVDEIVKVNERLLAQVQTALDDLRSIYGNEPNSFDIGSVEDVLKRIKPSEN